MRTIQQLLTLSLLALTTPSLIAAQEIKLADFLSSRMSDEQVVSIKTEPSTIYFERAKDSYNVEVILDTGDIILN